MRRWRPTLLIGLVFGGLLVFSLLLNVARRQQIPIITVTAPVSVELFPAVQPSDITRITVTDHTTGQSVTLTRVPGDWQGVNGQGTPAPVDLPNVTRMIQILGTLRYNRMLEESNVAIYGLAGDGKVTVAFDAGASYQLRIGDAAPAGDLTYVQRGGDTAIYLVPSAVLTLLTDALVSPASTP